ncbi:MAG: hypothetical protein DDT19_02100 [Syntrophomonadaceae bacterium]|nr:hypothetical protein [Bacillota bacterium]
MIDSVLIVLFDSLVATFVTGAVSGAPTAMSIVCRVQHGNVVGGGDMADIAGAVATITTADSIAEINIDCRPLGRFVRVIMTTTFTGGTAPTVLIAATIALGKSVWLSVV